MVHPKNYFIFLINLPGLIIKKTKTIELLYYLLFLQDFYWNFKPLDIH